MVFSIFIRLLYPEPIDLFVIIAISISAPLACVFTLSFLNKLIKDFGIKTFYAALPIIVFIFMILSFV